MSADMNKLAETVIKNFEESGQLTKDSIRIEDDFDMARGRIKSEEKKRVRHKLLPTKGPGSEWAGVLVPREDEEEDS